MRPVSTWKPRPTRWYSRFGVEKIARIHEYLDSQEALEAAGLSE